MRSRGCDQRALSSRTCRIHVLLEKMSLQAHHLLPTFLSLCTFTPGGCECGTPPSSRVVLGVSGVQPPTHNARLAPRSQLAGDPEGLRPNSIIPISRHSLEIAEQLSQRSQVLPCSIGSTVRSSSVHIRCYEQSLNKVSHETQTTS